METVNMKTKYCKCAKLKLRPDIDDNKNCVRCGKKVHDYLRAYKKIRKTTLIDVRTKKKESDKIYNRKKIKQIIRKRISEEV